jgi:hypothetical protein
MRVQLYRAALLSAAIFSLPNYSYGAENWYRVELLVFTQGNQAGIDTERWPENPPLSYPLNAIHLQPAKAVTTQLLADQLKSASLITEDNEAVIYNSDWDIALLSSDEPVPQQIALGEQSNTVVRVSSLDQNSELALGQEASQIITQAATPPKSVLAIAPSVKNWVDELYELWRQNRALSGDSESNAIDATLVDNDTSFAGDSGPQNNLPQWQSELDEIALLVQKFAEYVPLDEDIFEFSDAKLRANRYRVLHHSAWHQFIPPASNGESVIVLGGRQLGEHFELEGSISLDRQQRYVHADINLWMSTFKLALSDEGLIEHLPPIPPKSITLSDVDLYPGDNSDGSNPFNFNDSQTMPSGFAVPSLVEGPANSESWVSTQHFSLNAVQRMRSGVQYYVDHPGFGVIIKLTRYEDRQERMDSLLPSLVSDSELSD